MTAIKTMRQPVLAGLLMACSMSVYAQTWLADQKIRICENVISCNDDRHTELKNSEI